jgi:CubicO group peptidase (beta-lactamase class C family)
MGRTALAQLYTIARTNEHDSGQDAWHQNHVAELKGTACGEKPIRHLSTMSSGVRFGEVNSSADDLSTMVRLSVLRESDGGAATVMPFRTRECAPGEPFQHSSADTQVLGLLTRTVAGKPLADDLSEKIWKPMGAEADGS